MTVHSLIMYSVKAFITHKNMSLALIVTTEITKIMIIKKWKAIHSIQSFLSRINLCHGSNGLQG